MEAATVLEITPATLRARAQTSRERADRLREEARAALTDAVRLDREADLLEHAENLRQAQAPAPSARAVLAGEIAAYLARCRKPKSSGEIAEHFAVSTQRARQSLELLTEIGMVFRTGLKRGTRYRILRDGEEPPSHPQPFGERWHERVRDVAIELGTFTTAEIVEAIPELSASTVRRWVARLVEDGILSCERVGTANVYAYEREAPAPARPRTREATEVRNGNGSAPVAGTGRSKRQRADVAEVIRVAKAAGAEIKPQKHGYAVVVDGGIVTSIPKTPSDHRSLKNARGAMRRGGLRDA